MVHTSVTITYVTLKYFFLQYELGVLKQGFIIGNASEGVVEVQKITFCKDEDEQPILGSFQCPKVKKTD